MPEVTPIAAVDVPRVAAFLAAFSGDKFSEEVWRARLRAWWELNPTFVEGGTARGWLLREGAEIVGVFGNIPLPFQQDDRETVVHAGTTWRVLPAYRGLSMALKRRQMQEHRGALHFSTTPAPQVVALLKVLGYQLISQWQGGDEQSVIGLNFRTLFAARLKGMPFSRLGAAVLAPFAVAWQALKLGKLRASRRLDVRELAQVTPAFDELWARTRARYAFTNVRTATAIEWYCFGVPSGRKKLLGCFDGERLLGYLVLLLEAEPSRLVARCVDLWTDPAAGDSVIAALLAGTWKSATSERCDQIVLPHFHAELAEAYGRLGVPRRPAWNRRAYLAGPKEVLAKMTPANTYLVEAQGDVGL